MRIEASVLHHLQKSGKVALSVGTNEVHTLSSRKSGFRSVRNVSLMFYIIWALESQNLHSVACSVHEWNIRPSDNDEVFMLKT